MDRRFRSQFSIFFGVLLLALSLAPAVPLAAAPSALPASARAFVEKHCLECHDSVMEEAGLNLEALPFEMGDAATFGKWVRIHDRVRDGEMPPRKKPRPEPAELDAFLQSLAEPMLAAESERVATRGRATLRRLNRYEYENTLRDLLDAPWLQLKDSLPEDGESHRFNKVGSALDISHVQMARYMSTADAAIRQVLAAEPVSSEITRHHARDQKSMIHRMIYTSFNRSPERTTTPLLDHEAQVDVLEERSPVSVGKGNPEVRDREAFGVVNGNYIGNQLHFDNFEAKAGGRYLLRFRTYTYWAGPGGTNDHSSSSAWWKPDRSQASRGHGPEPVTIYAYTPPREARLLGSFDALPDPQTVEMDVLLAPGESSKPDAASMFRSRPGWKGNPRATKDGMPGVAYAWMEVEGPLREEGPSHGYQVLFGDLPLRKDAQGSPQLISKDPQTDCARLLDAFVRHAYRREPHDKEMALFRAIIQGALDSGSSFMDAMIAGYTAVLCSPGFLYLEERPGRLDGIALASRLAYFIWNSPPDEALHELAKSGALAQTDTLRAQAERLLDSPKSTRFLDAFLDYWLDLRKIGATTPDSTLYPDYYLDDLILESAAAETRLYVAELVRQDLPARFIVDSDFTMLNHRLARHYGLPPVDGVELRRVNLPKGSERGGLMTQASILKITANGTTTSPVLRGAWIMERILGKPVPPPPPNVPAIEPDTRGATTIRDQLDKHRAVPVCASCHSKMDPAGFALESFDILGGHRDRYRALGDNGDPVEGVGQNGHLFAFSLAQPVDASGNLPDGRPFEDVRGLKKLLLADERQIARNLVQQLVVYATGAPVSFGDRPEVERILDRARPSGYGVRTLIKELVTSEMFRNK